MIHTFYDFSFFYIIQNQKTKLHSAISRVINTQYFIFWDESEARPEALL